MKLAVVLIASFLSVAVNAASFGSQRCTWGPAYWCDHPVKAKECGTEAVDYCIQNEWSKIKVDDDSVCNECKSFIGEVRDVLNSGDLQADVITLIKSLCDKLGSKAETCKEIVDLFGKELLEKLVTELDPSKVCTLLDLCQKASSSKINKQLLSQVKADPCTDCKQIFIDLKDTLGNVTVQHIIFDEVIMVCQMLGVSADNCKNYINTYGPLVLDELLQFLDGDQICKDIGLCTANNKVEHALLKKVTGPNADPCVNCKQIFSDLDDILGNKSVQQLILKQVMKACTGLGLPDTICQEVALFEPEVLNYIIQLLNPDMVCSYLGQCSSDVKLRLSKLVQQSNKLQVTTANGDICTDCEQIVADLKDLLSNQTIVASVETLLDSLCESLGISSDICSQYINQYGPIVVNFIISELDSSTICKGLEMCSSSGLNKLHFFISTVKKVARGNGDACKDCKEIITDLGDLLNNSTVQNAIFDELISLCEALGQPADMCTTYIKKYGQVVIIFIEGYLQPYQICTGAKLCVSSVNVVKPALLTTAFQVSAVELIPALPVLDLKTQSGPALGESSDCTMCKLIGNELKDLLQKPSTQEDIESSLDKVCSLLPSIVQDSCDAFIKQYTPALTDVLVTDFPPEYLCQLIKVCSSGVSVVEEVGESVECVLCKYVMEELDHLLEGKTAVADIEAALDKVCSFLPEAEQSDCTSFVNQYTPEIVKLLVSELSANEICAVLKLCATSSATMLKLKPVGGANCGLCEEIAGYVELILKDGSTEKEIENFLSSEVCSKLEGALQTDCLDVVDRYLPEIIQLVTTMTPEKLCAVLGLCTAGKTAEVKQIEIEAEVDSGAECMICELIVKEIRSELSQNASQVEIQKFLDMVCSKIPLSKYSSECTGFVDDYTKPIIQLLLSEMDPDQLCVTLGVCSTNKEVAVSKVESGSLCLVCDVIFGIIDTQLELNKTTAEVTKMIENVCTVLPESLNKQCMSFLDLYGPMFLKLIVDSELEPSDICKEIKLCTSLTRPKLGNGTASCATCKEIVTAVEELVNQSKDEVIDEIAKVCNLFPVADQQECKNYVEVYGPYILDLLLEEVFTPSEICQVLRMCPKSLEGLLKVDACKFGPTYWCASKQKAIKCGAVEHCSRHVWI